MVAIGIALHQTRNLDIRGLVPVFTQCLHRFRNEQDSSSSLDIVLLDSFTAYEELDEVLGKLYSMGRDVLLSENMYTIPINVLFGECNKIGEKNKQWDVLFAMEENLLMPNTYEELKVFDCPLLSTKPQHLHEENQDKYKVSALGGTFDHLHDGHKILLSIAAFLTSSRLIIGITQEELLQKKKFQTLLESFEKRCSSVKSFLAKLKPSLKVEIVPLRDVCGPTGTVPEIEALIVSRETVNGGEVVNKTRQERGLHRLDICVVNVLGGKEEDGWSEKLSSTELRRLILESKNNDN